MVPSLIFDLAGVDLNALRYDVTGIEQANPHRHGMRMLDGIIHTNQDVTEAVAFKDVRDDEFWVPGHIPGRPVFPGVLMIEAAAQLASFLTVTSLGQEKIGQERFIGFVCADKVKFRGQVTPGQRLIILGKLLELRRNRSTYATQGLVDGKIVFEANVTGMPI